MNRNKIRHKILRLLVENFNAVKEKYGDGDGFIFPMYEDKIPIPVNIIMDRLKISYNDFDNVITKSIRDEALKYDDTNDAQQCITLAENTLLLYKEKFYLNQKSEWKDRNPFAYQIIIILITAFVSVLTTLSIAKFQRRTQSREQSKIDIRQDSLINKLIDSLKVLHKMP